MKKNKGNPNPSKPFVKGDPRCHRGGRPPLPQDLKEVKKLSNTYIEKLIAKFFNMSEEQLNEVIASPRTPVGEKMIARNCQEAIINGDYTRLNFLLDRSIGKVKEVKELQLPTPTVVKKLDGSEAVVMGDTKELAKAEVMDDE